MVSITARFQKRNNKKISDLFRGFFVHPLGEGFPPFYKGRRGGVMRETTPSGLLAVSPL